VTSRPDLNETWYCATAEVVRRRRRGQPIPQWLAQFHATLHTEISGLTQPRHRGPEIGGDKRQLKQDDLLSTEEVAELLNWSPRKVQRRKTDLGGRIVGRGLVFDRSVILEFKRKGH